MSENNLSEVFFYDTIIDDAGNINIPAEKMKELKEKGINKVRIKVYASAEAAAEVSGYEVSLFERIRDLQRLPGFVVLDMLRLKGKAEKNLQNRLTRFYE